MDSERHSFGGHALDRYVFDFETVEAPEAGATVAAPSAGEPATDPGIVQPEPAGQPSPEPAAPAEAPAGLTRDDVAAIVGQSLQAELARLAEANQPQPEPPPGFDWATVDPFADNYGLNLAQGIGELIREAIAPIAAQVAPVVQSSAAREAQEWTDQQTTLLGIPVETREELGDGGMSTRDYVLYHAGGIEMSAREAGLRVDGADILKHAWSQIQARDKRIGDAAVAKYKTELEEGVARADGAPSATGGFAALDGIPADGDELSVARALAERIG